MTMMPGTYYCKDKSIVGDRVTVSYSLVLDGEVVGTVKTRKEAQRWFDRTMADLKRMEISMLREAKARRYALHI